MAVAAESRRSLDGNRFDIIVIGGGINGVAVARECARAGRRTLLLEQHDFAAGATSRSTRIIHGGLRYLEHGELGLVRDALRERERLLRERSHLVRPLRVVLALPEGGRHSALAVRAGLWLYETMGGGRRNASRPLRSAELESLLDSGQRLSLFEYDDAQCEFPERLVAEWLGEALVAGLVARNYTRVMAIDTAFGRATGLMVRDLLTGGEARIQAQWIVNAGGPWVDRICACSTMRMTQPLVGGVRGSHLVLQPFPGMPEAAIYTEAVDGRPLFVIPWNGRLLVGTTEVRDDGDPGRAEPAPEESDYLLHSLSALFPQATISPDQVECSFAGIRPLPYSPGRKPSAVTRRHLLHEHSEEGAAGLISVIGGKLTTAPSLARECARGMGIPAREPELTLASAPSAQAIEGALHDWARQVAGIAQITEASARALAEWHGPGALRIARAAAADPRLRAPLCEHSHHIVAEASIAVESEMAVHLADILLRRVPVALSPCFSGECADEAARQIGSVLGWGEGRLATELEDFRIEREAFLRKLPQPAAVRA